MTPELLLAFVLFAFVTSVTPGPNNMMLLAPLFALVNGPSVGLWTVAGSLLRKLLQDSRKRRLFNHGMAMLLVLSLYPILAERGL